MNQFGRLPRPREGQRLAAGFDRFDQPGDRIVARAAAGERIACPAATGFHSAKYFRPRGEPSSSITVTSRPTSRLASSPGLAIVALAARNTGREP